MGTDSHTVEVLLPGQRQYIIMSDSQVDPSELYKLWIRMHEWNQPTCKVRRSLLLIQELISDHFHPDI